MKVYPVPPMAVAPTWPLIAEGMEPSLRVSDTHDAKDVIALCQSGKCFMYVQVDDDKNIHAAAVMDFVTYPKGRECRAWLVGSIGDPDWQQFTDFLIDEARKHHCRWFGGFGRPGWNKYVGGKTFPCIRKELSS